MNFNKTLPTDRRATIDQATFERIIGPVNDKVYNKELNEKGDHRCVNAFKKQHKVIPLTVRETHKWRKTFEHLDFRKQPETGR